MTDTEILDYLNHSVRSGQRWTYDVQVGSVVFTLYANKLAKSSLRELLLQAIEEDQARLAARAAKELTKR